MIFPANPGASAAWDCCLSAVINGVDPGGSAVNAVAM